jgi:hypothetical protein
MQYSIVEYSEIQQMPDFRFDAECYHPYYLQMEEALTRWPYSTIGDLSVSVINFGAYSLCNCIEFLDEGIPFLVTEDIKPNIVDTSRLHYISESVHHILRKSHCKKGKSF